jgi:hypothetical protein
VLRDSREGAKEKERRKGIALRQTLRAFTSSSRLCVKLYRIQSENTDEEWAQHW